MRAAVVDDMQEDAQRLIMFLKRYQTEYGHDMQVDVYHASFDFLEEYQSQYDVIFLDIEMPGSDGIEVAHEIRSRDEAVGIIFVTNMGQYAIKGYEVNAIDFIVKPVGYYVFAEKMQKAISFFQKRENRNLLLSREDGIYRISVQNIQYIEKEKDDLVFHTVEGIFRERGSIKTLKDKLTGCSFSECTAGCLVNLAKVVRVGKEDITVGQIQLPLSRRLKKSFTQEYISYIGGGF